MGYMTADFARLQNRKFNVYSYDDKERKDAEERARQLEEHRVRMANAKKKKSKKV